MDIAAGYKITEIGVIPEDWNVVKFDDVFDLSTSSIKTEDFDVSNYVSTENLLQQKKGVMPYLSDISYASVKEYLVNDILVSNIRPYLKKIWLSDKNAGCSSDVLVVRCKANGLITPSFAYYPLSDDKFFSYATDTAIGTKMPRGDKKAIREYKFALPSSTDEQVRISKTILDFDKYIEGVDIEITKKKLLKEGAMQELLTGKTRLAGFSGEWCEVKLGDILTVKSGYPFKSETYSAFGDYKIITISNVKNGKLDMSEYNKLTTCPIDLQNHHKLKIGDIIVSMTGNVGRVCIVDTEKCLLNQRVGLLSFDKLYQLDKGFIYNILNSEKFETYLIKKGQGAAQANIGNKDIESYSMYIPKDVNEQAAIASILSDLDAEIKALEAEYDKYTLIKQGMMQQLLTGQIRLK